MRINKIFGGEDGENLGGNKNHFPQTTCSDNSEFILSLTVAVAKDWAYHQKGSVILNNKA